MSLPTNILITGAYGQIGRELVDLCILNNIKCYYFSSELDITNLNIIRTFLSSISNIGILINCSGYTAVDKAEENPEKAFLVNSLGIRNLAIICKEKNIPLIHLSTDYIFSGESLIPYDENATPKPINIYGMSKYDGEKLLQDIWKKHIILRVSWVFGKYGNNFVKTVINLAKKNEILSIVGDQKGCPTPALSIAEALLKISKKVLSGNESWGVYHYCGNSVTTWFDFANEIIEKSQSIHDFKMKKIIKIKSDNYPFKAKRPLNSELLVEKITQEFFINSPDWKKILIEVINGK